MLMVVGLLFPVALIGFDFYMKQFKEYVPTKLGIQQNKLSDKFDFESPQMLIDKEKGSVRMSGWDINVEEKIFVNHFYATPLSSSILPVNKFKFKAWNYFLLYTPTHVIQFIFADLSIACSSSIIIFELGSKDPHSTMTRVEEMFSCP